MKVKSNGHKQDSLGKLGKPLKQIMADTDSLTDHVQATLLGQVCKTCKKHMSKCVCAKNGRGAKFSEGKLDWTLLPIPSLEGVVRVLMHGMKKYARDNWKKVPDGEAEYMKAFFRHLIAYLSDEEIDEPSGMYHWDQVVCNAIFICWFRQQRMKQPK